MPCWDLACWSAYQACLAHELRKRGFAVACQVGLPVVFDGEKIELGYRIDLVVENAVYRRSEERGSDPSGAPGTNLVIHATERHWSRPAH